MNIYKVVIEDEEYSVTASGVLSAIRKAINEDNRDRRENGWFYLDREVKEHQLQITIDFIEVYEEAQEEQAALLAALGEGEG